MLELAVTFNNKKVTDVLIVPGEVIKNPAIGQQ